MATPWLNAVPSASSLPLSYLVDVLTERDEQLLNHLHQVVEAKRRELRGGESRRGEAPSKKPSQRQTQR